MDFAGASGFEEEFDGFKEVGAGLLSRFPLAGDVKFGAEGDVFVAVALDESG